MTEMPDEEMGSVAWMPSAAVIAAEIAVLGAAIQSRSAAETMVEKLTADDFFRPAHQSVYEAIAALVADVKPVDPAAVLNELTHQGTASRMGGGVALATLMERGALPGAVAHHAAIVVADAVRRRVYGAGLRIRQIAESEGFEVDTDVEIVRKVLDDACLTVTSDEPPTVSELLTEVIEELEKPLDAQALVPPPYVDMQMLMPGFRPGQMVTLGARPATGKSTIALDWARHTAIRLRMSTLLITLEMSAQETMQRLLAAEASVLLGDIQSRNLSERDWDKITRVHGKVTDAPLIVDDNPDCSIARIRSRLRSMQRRDPARLVIIDYLQLLRAPKADTRERAVAELARSLKLLAREFQVPFLVLAQLNRGPEQRTDKRPVMSDLRESGALEQDSDIVLLLHREEMHDQESPRSGECDLIIAKHRNGPRGTVTIGFMGHYARGCNLTKDVPPSGWNS